MNRISSARVSRSAGGLRVLAALAFLAASGCHSLEVTNPNDPDLTRALASGTDVQSLMGGAYHKWIMAQLDISVGHSGPGIVQDVASDHYESAWGNWGMKQQGWEPRLYPLVNSHTDASDNYRNDVEVPWYDNYGSLVSANLVLKALANGVAIPGPIDSTSNPMIRAAARLMQGLALAQIALNYDSGYAFDENYDPTGPALNLVPRDSVLRAAMVKFDAAISLASAAGQSWSLPTTFTNNTGWTATQVAEVANTYAARALADFPHNATENAAVNWAKVASYASKGISAGTQPLDLEIIGDGGTTAWWDDFLGSGEAIFDWMRVSERTVCLLDAAFKCHHANAQVQDSIPQSADYRFNGDDVVGDNCVAGSFASYVKSSVDPSGKSYGAHCSTADKTGGADFFYADNQYGPTWPGYPTSRGIWRFSNVSHIRYFDVGWDGGLYSQGALPLMLRGENDLIWAEALVMQNTSLAQAAGLINTTRVGRGHLTALTGAEGQAALLAAIKYEKAIELWGTDPGMTWMDARRWAPDLAGLHYFAGTGADGDTVTTGWKPYGQGLQPQTFRLLPVPQQELTLIGHNIYTFGGPGLPEPSAPVAGVAHRVGLFGTTGDGSPILGPGKWNAISDAMFAASVREHAARNVARQ